MSEVESSFLFCESLIGSFLFSHALIGLLRIKKRLLDFSSPEKLLSSHVSDFSLLK